MTVLRAGLIGAVPIGALLAIFAFDRNVVILLIPVLGFACWGCQLLRVEWSVVVGGVL